MSLELIFMNLLRTVSCDKIICLAATLAVWFFFVLLSEELYPCRPPPAPLSKINGIYRMLSPAMQQIVLLQA